jgi:alpha-N-arabinofuranosidase
VHGEAHEFGLYQKVFPAMIDSKTFMSMDEYAYTGGGGAGRGTTLKTALAYGMTLNEMLRHTDFLKMAAFTSGVGLMDYTRTGAVMNATGEVFKLFSEHFPDSIPVAVSGNSPQPDQNGSGSSTYPLDIVSAISSDHKYLIMSVVNATAEDQKMSISTTGAQTSGSATLWQIAGSLDSANRVGQTPQVEIKQSSVDSTQNAIDVAPDSINIYQFPLGK